MELNNNNILTCFKSQIVEKRWFLKIKNSKEDLNRKKKTYLLATSGHFEINNGGSYCTQSGTGTVEFAKFGV